MSATFFCFVSFGTPYRCFFSVFFFGGVHTLPLAIFDKDASHFLLCRHPSATLSNNALPLSFCFHHPDIFSNVVLYVRPNSTAFQNRCFSQKNNFLFLELPTVLHMALLCTSEGRWRRRRPDEEWKEERFAR